MSEVATELSSKPIAQEIEQRLSGITEELRNHDPRIVPALAIVTDNPLHPPTRTYLELKSKIANRVGVTSHLVELVHDGTDQLIDNIDRLNVRPDIDGIIVQLPLYINARKNTDEVLEAILPSKDVDGLSTKAEYPSATSTAVMELLKWYDVGFREQEVAVFGLGRLVGAPLLGLLDSNGASQVTAVDKNTSAEDRLTILNRAPIIVSAMGVPEAITPDLFEHLDQPRVLIDAGTAEQSGEMFGDVSDDLREVASEYGWRLTPKKGWGVGSLTVRTLLSHVVDAAEKRAEAS